MASSILELKPASLWKYFNEICKIPHCSKQEGPLSEYVLSVAKETGHEAHTDQAGNVVIRVPATPGHEKAPTIVLQGHLDMVCEKNSDCSHDFSNDPIAAVIEGDWVTAEGTTLGADNGIGVAAGLALLEEKDAVHGPLELLFTVDEETGLNGAQSLKPDFIKGRILLNLDSEEEGTFFIGCAGGADSETTLPLERVAGQGTCMELKLSGLRGGHSGLDISTGRGNAVQLLARMLHKADKPFQLISLEGGSKHNAIPREAFAQIMINETHMADLEKTLKSRFEGIRFEYRAVEKDMKFAMVPEKPKGDPMDEDSRDRFLALLVGLPHGVIAMSQEIEALVETSNNLAIVQTQPDYATVYTSTRSSIGSALEAARKKIEAIATLAGAEIKHLEGYPPWTPNLQSELLKKMKSIYAKIASKEPQAMAIHAGLECGIIGEKYPGMDMISFGPDLKNPHSPDEKVHAGSVERFYQLIKSTLKALA